MLKTSDKAVSENSKEAASPQQEVSNNTKDEKKLFQDELIVVGIGASAGGLEALQKLLETIPKEPGVALVVCQHLDPRHETLLTTLLSRCTKLPVLDAEHGQQISSNHVYVTPPNANITITNDYFELSVPSELPGPKPSVDLFFNSLALEKKELSVGIILSGTGSDGAHGVQSIKAAGGLVIVQQEETAKYNGMPRSAINTGCVELTLPPEEIWHELSILLNSPNLILPAVELVDEANYLERICQSILAHLDHDFSGYRKNTLSHRIERRMVANKMGNIIDYINLLEESTHEVELLYNEILISVTSFFRDPNAFKKLETLLAQTLSQKQQGDMLRIWVPGCATGEEAYSIAILVSQLLDDKLHELNIQIFATDLDEKLIRVARQGHYPNAALKGVPKKILEHYFIASGNSCQVIKPIREMVIFSKHDLLRDPPFLKLDLVSCRNLLIYLKPETQSQVLHLFHYALNSKGHLFLGKSETVGQVSDLFTPFDSPTKIYSCKPGIQRMTENVTLSNKHVYRRYRASKRVKTEHTPEYLFKSSITQAYAPNGVLISNEGNIIHTHGNIAPYISTSSGSFDSNLLRLIRKELRLELRTMLHKVKQSQEALQSKPIRIEGIEDAPFISISVHPTSSEEEPLDYFIVCFEKKHTATQTPLQLLEIKDENAAVRVIELEQELASTKEHLQTVLEELETSNEELQSLAEELQSSNEELQSTNEELETSNEELQSTNEELITVNEELNVRSNELSSSNMDLLNIQNSIEIPLMVVDSHFRVTRFTPGCYNIFEITNEHLGHIITAIPCRFSLPELRDWLAQVIEGKRLDQKLELNDHLYQLKIIPYYTDGKHITGAILTFIDQTEVIRQQNEALPSPLPTTETRFDENAVTDVNDVNEKLKVYEERLEKSHLELNEFAYITSHDLKEPLRGIQNYAEFALRDCHEALGDKGKHRLERLVSLSQHMSELIDSLLYYSKIGHDNLFIQKADFNSIIDDVARRVKHAIEKNNVILRIPKALPDVECDKTYLREVWYHLISNAIKYNDKTDRWVEIGMLEDSETPTFYIKDNGVGIDPENQENIFRIFRRAHSRDRFEASLGVGLTFAKKIIERHEGRIWLTSELNQGTTFFFTLK